MNQIPTATLLVSYTHQDAKEQTAFDILGQKLSARLNQPVVPCPLDGPGNSLLSGISVALQQGAVRIVTLPLLLSPAEYQNNVVAKAIAFASRRWPFIQFHLSPPPGWAEWLSVCSDLIGKPAVNQGKTAIILTGRGDVEPDINSDVSKLARLLYESGDVGWVEVAFVANTTPSIREVVARCRRMGTQRIIVVPYVLFAGQAYNQAKADAGAEGVEITLDLSSSGSLVEVLLARYAAALEDRTLLPVSWEEVQRQLIAGLNSHDKVRPGQPAADEDEFRQLTARIEAILPPRYQGRTAEISAAPMAAADLVFDDDGAVAWDQVFGLDDPDNPFCELALAGGPSHRGELLEAPLPADCEAEPGKYAAVLAEIERGIRMITGLPVVDSETLGWVGVKCDSEEMAIWLVRAIIVENVMVRRERSLIYLPAGPGFTLKNEIKSIVTVTAKTWHYWIEHITYQQRQKTAEIEAGRAF